MKLLIILSIEEYADEVRRILVNQRIPIYSETEIKGCRCDNGKGSGSDKLVCQCGYHGVFPLVFRLSG